MAILSAVPMAAVGLFWTTSCLSNSLAAKHLFRKARQGFSDGPIGRRVPSAQSECRSDGDRPRGAGLGVLASFRGTDAGEEVQDGTCGAVTSHYIVSIIGCVGRVFLAFSHHTQLLVIRPSLTKCSVTSQCTHTACVDRHAKRRPRCTHRTHTTQMHIRDEDKH